MAWISLNAAYRSSFFFGAELAVPLTEENAVAKFSDEKSAAKPASDCVVIDAAAVVVGVGGIATTRPLPPTSPVADRVGCSGTSDGCW